MKGKDFRTVKKWKDLKVIEGRLPETIRGVSLPWDATGKYRIFINSDLSPVGSWRYSSMR